MKNLMSSVCERRSGESAYTKSSGERERARKNESQRNHSERERENKAGNRKTIVNPIA